MKVTCSSQASQSRAPNVEQASGLRVANTQAKASLTEERKLESLRYMGPSGATDRDLQLLRLCAQKLKILALGNPFSIFVKRSNSIERLLLIYVRKI